MALSGRRAYQGWDLLFDPPFIVLADGDPPRERVLRGRQQARTARGFRYAGADGVPEGIALLTLIAGPDGRAQIRLKAMGTNLDLPALPLDDAPAITVQLTNARGVCWEAEFTAPAAANDATQFRDGSD